MAIQNRRGSFADYDPSKLKPGEYAIVQSGDPNSSDGRAVYICLSAGNVKQLASMDELKSYNLEAAAAAETAKEKAKEAADAYIKANQAMQCAEQANADATAKLASIEPKVMEALERISTQGETTAGQIADLKTDALAGIEKAKTDAANDLADRKADAMNNLDIQRQEAVKEVQDEKAAALEIINKKTEIIQQLTFDSDQLATQALSKANNLENEVAEAMNVLNRVQADGNRMQLTIEGKVDGAYTENGYLILTSNNEPVTDPIGPFAGGGGGGGSGTGNGATLSVQNNTGWLSKTIAAGDPCFINLTWTSEEDEMPTGDGTLKLTVNGVVKAAINVSQGNVSVDISKHLASGSNVVKANIADAYGNSRTINFSVTVIALGLTSPFDASSPFSGAISFPYVPTGSVQKTVHFLIDGKEIGTVETPVSNRQMSYTIKAQSHGAHTLECYFDAEINGAIVQSNTLYYELICIQPLNLTPIVVSPFNEKEVDQYRTLRIEYMVYDPSALTAPVVLQADGQTVAELTVDRSRQTWAYRCNEIGDHTLTISSGGVTKTFRLTVNEVKLDIEAETQDLALFLSSYGRSNGEADPDEWKYGNIKAALTGFNGVNDRWQLDEDGITVLRVRDEARVEIPYQIFGEDFRTTGKTISLEFRARDVRDYDAEIISCFSGNRGLKVTAQEARLKSEGSEIIMLFKDEDHIRLDFVIEKRADNRLVYIYVNGIISGSVRYPDTDDFSQTDPVGISIGSDLCAVDIYCLRVYDNNLNKQQVLNNWIMDTQDGVLMLERYARNNIYDEYGQVVISKLPKDLPYMILTASALPDYKGDKKTVQVQYTDPINSSKSFTAEDVGADVQGTSSAGYERKNYKLKYTNGFIVITGKIDGYAMRDDSIPAKVFTMKADVASSEGANNVVLARLANDLNTWKTPPQKANPKVRQSIDGFPIVIFHNNGTDTSFLGKYNFNNDKSTDEVYGFQEGDECWELCNNTSDRVLFKDDNFSDGAWLNDFEGRYPDGNTDSTHLAAFVSWVKSTAGNPTKFKQEAANWLEIDSALNYYVFAMCFLMVDSLAKNMMLTYFKETERWGMIWYDLDTGLGINNEGVLAFGYSLEDIDYLEGGAGVFNGQPSILWQNLRLAYPNEIAAKYKALRTGDNPLTFQRVIDMFLEHQNKWPEAIYNEDAQFKYFDPLIVSGKAEYLSMVQGKKESQRAWWLSNRFRYLDSKWNCGDDLTHAITLRGYSKANITVKPYLDMYVNIKYGSYLVSERANRNQEYTLVCPLSEVNDTEIYIYSADKIISVGDLSGLKVGYCDISTAEKLQSLKLGDASSSYKNANMKELHTGNNPLLKVIDCRNCTDLGTGTQSTVDVSGCTGIEELYFENTKISGINLPNGGLIKKLHLPSTITNLTILNQKKLADLSIPDYSNISTLRLENNSDAIDMLDMLSKIATNARVRLVGFNLGTVTVAELTAFMDELDSFRGLDDNGNNVDTAQVSGKCHITSLLGSEYATFKERYPYIEISYDHLTSYLYYMSDDGQTQLYKETIVDGGNGTWNGTPTKAQTAQYTYAFDGWSSAPGGALWPNAKIAVTADRYIYAHFKATVRTYTVYFYNGSTLLQTVQNVPYGGSCSYTAGSTSSITNSSGDPFTGWNPEPKNIVGNTSCYAQFVPMYTCTFKNGTETLYTVRVKQGTTVTYAGPSMTDVTDENGNPWIGWDKALTNIQANTTFNAVFYSFNETITDSWDTIISKIKNAATGADCGYNLGDIKVLDFGGDFGKVGMQLVAFDMDDLADGTGKAKTTWLTKELGTTSKRMNPDVQYIYGFRNGSSWDTMSGSTTSSKSATSQNRYSNGTDEITGHAVYTIKSATDQDVLIGWKTSASASCGLLSVTIDGEQVASEFASTTETTTTLSLTAEQTVTIDVAYKRTTASPTSSYYATLRVAPQGGGSVTYTSTVDQCLTRYTVGYKEGTGTSGGWPKTEMFTYVTGLKANLPTNVQNAIKKVTKTQPAYQETSTSSFTQSSQDDLWIPSYNEMFSSSTSQVRYTGFFTDNTSRKKSKVGAASASWWWLRSANTNYYFYGVYSSGGDDYYYANGSGGVAVGFCI